MFLLAELVLILISMIFATRYFREGAKVVKFVLGFTVLFTSSFQKLQ